MGAPLFYNKEMGLDSPRSFLIVGWFHVPWGRLTHRR